MTADRIVLHAMRFAGRHGVRDEERALPQPIEVDVELRYDLRPAGASDALAETVDYGRVFELCREIVEERSFRLLEAIAQHVADAILAQTAVEAVTVRVRKLRVPVRGHVDHAEVEIDRTRADGARALDV